MADEKPAEKVSMRKAREKWGNKGRTVAHAEARAAAKGEAPKPK